MNSKKKIQKLSRSLKSISQHIGIIAFLLLFLNYNILNSANCKTFKIGDIKSLQTKHIESVHHQKSIAASNSPGTNKADENHHKKANHHQEKDYCFYCLLLAGGYSFTLIQSVALTSAPFVDNAILFTPYSFYSFTFFPGNPQRAPPKHTIFT